MLNSSWIVIKHGTHNILRILLEIHFLKYNHFLYYVKFQIFFLIA